MELTNTFTVGLPVEETWKVLTDLERVAPCLPGAALLGRDGTDYRGAVKIKVGPVSAKYQGTARFVECDSTAHRAVIQAEGKDTGGQGNASATVTASLREQGGGTQVDLLTDLTLSGRVAQFGRGVISDVSNKLLGQFAQRLEDEVASGAGQAAVQDETTSGAARTAASIDEVEPLDISGMSGVLAKRALPVAGGVLALLAVVLLVRKAGRSSTSGPECGPNAGSGVPLVINLTLPSAGPAVRRLDEEVERAWWT